MFFLSLFNSAASPDALVQPDANSILATFDAQLRDLADAVGQQFDAQSGVASLAAMLAEVERQFAVAPPTMTGELEQALASLRQDLSLMPSAQAVVFDIVGPAVAGSIAYGNGSSVAFSAAGTVGQVLVSNGAAAPSWSTLSNVTSISFGTTGLTPASATSGAVTVAGTLAVANGGTGLTSWTANGLVYASSTTALANGSNVTYNGTKLEVSGKQSYFDPTLTSSGGLNVLASYAYNNGTANTIGGGFHNAFNVIYVGSTAGLTAIPVFSNGGNGVAYAYNYLDPDNATWTFSAAGPTITFTQNGTGGNTFALVLSSATGDGTIQRTAGALAYTVYVQRLGI
jgi:hypothetical protein